jgi:sulfate adenylyltransferase
MTSKHISGTEQRKLLEEGKDIPEWFSFPEVVRELKQIYRPNYEKGFCLYFVGLSGSGKSVLSSLLNDKLRELLPDRPVTTLDGDIVRKNLSSGLGFSKEDRSKNVKRIGYVASEVVKHRGICLCSNIAPYDEDRLYNRKIISKYGGYIEIFVDTSLEKCEERDCKGLYKLARQGVIKQFTGISDPFEIPSQANITLRNHSVDDLEKNINNIVDYLRSTNYLR